MNLEPLTPEEAVEQYLASRKADASPTTIKNHRYRLKQFLIWADQQGLDNMNDVSGRTAERFKNYRLNECDINTITLEAHLRTFRLLLRWCEANEAVEPGVADKLIIPRLPEKEKVREEFVDYDTAEEIIDYLMKYEYANLSHIIFHLLWHSGMRRGALHSLDLEDWHPDESILCIRNREGTPLKLGDEGERNINITDNRLVQALSDYVDQNRHDVSDDMGRKPLLTTRYGRPHLTTIQNNVYRVTRPCFYSSRCPHDRDIDECEATDPQKYASCPSSVSPHPIRRGAITAHLNRNVPMQIASERMSVSVDTLELHYDARSLEEKRENRRQYLDNI
jgi:integrase